MITLVCVHAHQAVTHPLGTTESDWVRRAGVIIAGVGAITAAWNGAVWLAREIGDKTSRWFRKLRGFLAYLWLRLLRRPTTRHVVSADAFGAVDMAGNLTIRASGFVWPSRASAAEKADLLYQEIVKIQGRINELDQKVDANHTEIRGLVEAQVGELRDAHRKLEDLLAARERQEARVDGRGLLAILFGIILTGIPDELAHWPIMGWIVTAVFAALTAVIVRGVLRDQH